MLPAALVVLGILLTVAWVLASRRHIERSQRQNAEWDAGTTRPDLWTSEAACVHCGAHGGLVEVVGDEVQFACLSCGRRHGRSARG